MEEKMKKMNKNLWFLVFLTPVVALILALIISLWLAELVILIITAVVIAIYIATAIGTSLKQVPNKFVWVTEIFGEYAKELKAGLNFIVPFGLEKISSQVFLGQQIMALYLDEQVKDGFGEGDVEFKDCSGVGVSAYLYFQLDDPKKATYEINALFEAIEEKADGILRVNFMMYTLDEAMNLKGKFNLYNIACYTDLKKNTVSVLPNNTVPALPNNTTADATKEDFENSDFYLSLKEFGVTPKSFVIADFRLPQGIIDQRAKKLEIEKDLEVAKVTLIKSRTEKKTAIVQAEGRSQAKILEGKGEAGRIGAILLSLKLEPEQSARYLTEMRKWDAISESKSADKVILIEENGQASSGAKFGTGFSAASKPQKT